MNSILKIHLNLTFSRSRSGTKPLQPQVPGGVLFCPWPLQPAQLKVTSADAPLWCLRVKPENRRKSLLAPKLNLLVRALPSAQTEPCPGEPLPTATLPGVRSHTTHGPPPLMGACTPPSHTKTPGSCSTKGILFGSQ